MTTPTLGRLERLSLRTAWKNEATHFTPWLAQEENIALLGQAIGMELEVQAQEQAVGPFRADILCRNTDDNTLILVENQLGKTDHSHLGQLLTYAAGLKAVTLVWIVERFTEEHRAALDWLNVITGEGFHFFGLEVELWKIGDSPPAPKFNIVVQPNEWARTVQRVGEGSGSALTAMGLLQVKYWTTFGEFLGKNKAPFKPPKPYPSNWMNWGLGRSGAHLVVIINSDAVIVGVEIDSREHPSWFHKLNSEVDAIEASLGFALEWDEKPGNKWSRLHARLTTQMREEANWPAAQQWMLEHMLALAAAFRPRVKVLDDEPMAELGVELT